jgi:hypothetical protein
MSTKFNIGMVGDISHQVTRFLGLPKYHRVLGKFTGRVGDQVVRPSLPTFILVTRYLARRRSWG